MVFSNTVKWILAIAAIVIFVPTTLALVWQFGHPKHFPIFIPHDFSKKGHKTETQSQFRCGWFVVCEEVPYDIKLTLPAKGNARFIDSIPTIADGTHIGLPGRYHVRILDTDKNAVVFDEVISGVRASLLHVTYKSDEKQIEAETEPTRKLRLAGGAYSISIENLENVSSFDDALGAIVIKWALK